MKWAYRLLFAIGCLLPSCKTAGLSEPGSAVALTREPLPPQCTSVGLLTGKGGGTLGGANVTNQGLIDHAFQDLRNKAADLGATHIQHDPPQLGSDGATTTSVTITGTAYACPSTFARSL